MAVKVKGFSSPTIENLEVQINDWFDTQDVCIIDTKYAMVESGCSCLVIYDTDPDAYDEEEVLTKDVAPGSPDKKPSVSEYLATKKSELEQTVHDRLQPAIANVEDLMVVVAAEITPTGDPQCTIEVLFFYPEKGSTRRLPFRATGRAATFQEAEGKFLSDFMGKSDSFLFVYGENTGTPATLNQRPHLN